ncbi:MAG: hypothetical protein AB7V13_15070 [Pseudorhodoplanes sp.]|uniref:hypothetical protein n=1 Tax=Pseudorhodoplanes sp. TaxID=1934341 RepID=UPI003D109911
MFFSVIRYLVAGSVCIMCLLSTAVAAPAADCVKKHAGRWQITVRATGQTYPADLFPNGTGVSHCPGCAPGTWTCSGNTSTVFVNGITVVTTLSPDGRTGTSSCCTSTRIGQGPKVASPSKQIAAKSSQPAEAGLIEGPSSRGIIQNPRRPLALELIPLLVEMNKASLEEWKRDHARDAQIQALMVRLNNLRDTMSKAAEEGRWNVVQRTMPVAKRIVAEVRALKAQTR